MRLTFLFLPLRDSYLALTVEECDKRIIVSLKKKNLLSGNNYVNSDFLQNGFEKIKER